MAIKIFKASVIIIHPNPGEKKRPTPADGHFRAFNITKNEF